MKQLLIAFLLIASTIYCEDKVIKRDGQPDTVITNSKKMDSAIKEAKENIKTFITLVKATKDYKNFFIKRGFPDDKGNHEHIWISLLKYGNGKFTGTLNNKPLNIKKMKLGQVVTVGEKEISDWMITSPKGLKGGYTLVALIYGTKDQETYQKQFGIDWKNYKFLKKIEDLLV